VDDKKINKMMDDIDLQNDRLTCLLDSSSAILLFKSGLFRILTRIYNTVIPLSVFMELTMEEEYPGAGEFKKSRERGDLRISEVDNSIYPGEEKMKYLNSLGAGERDIILLYYCKRGDFIIIDDKKGAAFCRDNDIPYINALLFPRILYLSELIEEIEYKTFFSKIKKNGRYSDMVIDFAFSASRNNLKEFIPEKYNDT